MRTSIVATVALGLSTWTGCLVVEEPADAGGPGLDATPQDSETADAREFSGSATLLGADGFVVEAATFLYDVHGAELPVSRVQVLLINVENRLCSLMEQIDRTQTSDYSRGILITVEVGVGNELVAGDYAIGGNPDDTQLGGTWLQYREDENNQILASRARSGTVTLTQLLPGLVAGTFDATVNGRLLTGSFDARLCTR